VPGFWPYGGVSADLLVMHASAAGSHIFNSLHQMREPQRRDFERHLCIATLVAVNAPGIRCPSRDLLALRGDATYLQELSNGHVELVFVICDDLCAVCGLNCGALERHTPKIAKRSGKLIPQ
jgi:hypothetical protein